MKPHPNRIISKKKFRDFIDAHPEHRFAKMIFHSWYKAASQGRWGSFSDVREAFGSADVVGKFVAFNVGGNKYRIVAEVNHKHARIYLRHVLTHDEYDRGKWKT